MIQLYQPGRRAYSASDIIGFDDIEARMLSWRKNVPASILLDTAYLPSVCPPPHILSLK